ncbi:TlpA family protein disulfide reductase [Nafulsella turpanensis]|uniref:TlpA family protein disulfide reductase n=1 Tax=Nafulsella turpanensis TaxID=1265690 RepID=UPI00034D556B|nr:hypothetical protein [Nafulsella turpanensis]
MKNRFIFALLFCYSFIAPAQDISFSSQQEHAVEWMEATSQFTGPAIGSQLPEEITEKIKNSAEAKKLYVLHFWYVGSGAMAAEADYLRKLQKEFKDQPNIAFISFVASPEEEVQAYVQENGNFGYKLLSLESPEELESQLGIKAFTTHMLVNGKGEILENFTAAIDFEEMYEHYRNKIQEQL